MENGGEIFKNLQSGPPLLFNNFSKRINCPDLYKKEGSHTTLVLLMIVYYLLQTSSFSRYWHWYFAGWRSMLFYSMACLHFISFNTCKLQQARKKFREFREVGFHAFMGTLTSKTWQI